MVRKEPMGNENNLVNTCANHFDFHLFNFHIFKKEDIHPCNNV